MQNPSKYEVVIKDKQGREYEWFPVSTVCEGLFIGEREKEKGSHDYDIRDEYGHTVVH